MIELVFAYDTFDLLFEALVKTQGSGHPSFARYQFGQLKSREQLGDLVRDEIDCSTTSIAYDESITNLVSSQTTMYWSYRMNTAYI